MNDHDKSQDTVQQSEYARELAQLLNILETVDRRITPEHVAQRFQELLEEDASRSVKEIRATALGKVSRIEEILRIAAEPQMIRRAIQRAGSRELAEDALQETVCAIAERKSLDPIENLSGFFYTALIREIDHQLRRQGAISAGDIGAVAEAALDRNRLPLAHPPVSVQDEARLRILAEVVLARFERGQARDTLMALIPARSDDPHRYRSAIVLAARQVFLMLLDGQVSAPDLNVILKAAYPQWCDEPGLARAAMDQRLSRARRDLQQLLRNLIQRDIDRFTVGS